MEKGETETEEERVRIGRGIEREGYRQKKERIEDIAYMF